MTSQIMTDNFLDTSVVSNFFASSEQAAFPDENIYNFQRRSKVWRSNGYWEITSSNSSLVFRETTAVDLTATLTEGTYTSTTALLAEIKSAMETVGASTYTIEQDSSTFKIKLTSDGAGGGGIFEIDWTTSTGLATTLGFLTTEEDTGALTYTADALVLHTEEWLKWDFGISTNPKVFILIGNRNSPIKISPTATLKLQGNETDAWSSPSFETTLTYDESVIFSFSSTGLHSEELRYWRLLIVDDNNGQGYVEIGSLFLGDYLELTRGRIQFPLNGQYIDRSVTVFSEGGQSFSDEGENSEQFSLFWRGLTVSDKEEIDRLFGDVKTAKPFFVRLDPDLAFSSSSDYYIRYVKFSQEPSYSLISPGFYEVEMILREEL